jgi:hypothetical protein
MNRARPKIFAATTTAINRVKCGRINSVPMTNLVAKQRRRLRAATSRGIISNLKIVSLSVSKFHSSQIEIR